MVAIRSRVPCLQLVGGVFVRPFAFDDGAQRGTGAARRFPWPTEGMGSGADTGGFSREQVETRRNEGGVRVDGDLIREMRRTGASVFAGYARICLVCDPFHGHVFGSACTCI